MANKTPLLLPRDQRILETLGENIKLARLRRRLSGQLVSERAGISRTTLISIEKGDEGVSIGFYLLVLHALGLEKDFLKLAADDVLGRKLQDLQLVTPKRAPKRKKND